MHSRLKHGTPDANPNESVDYRPAHAHEVCYESQSYSGKSYRETEKVNSVGIEKGDHQYRDNVVHDGQGGDKNLERHGHTIPKYGKHTKRECDIGGHWNAPTFLSFAAIVDR